MLHHSLRDTTAEAEIEYKRRIADTEKELELTYDLQGRQGTLWFSLILVVYDRS